MGGNNRAKHPDNGGHTVAAAIRTGSKIGYKVARGFGFGKVRTVRDGMVTFTTEGGKILTRGVAKVFTPDQVKAAREKAAKADDDIYISPRTGALGGTPVAVAEEE
jgi:hypothetical protein